jgi:hypothetical protein
VRSDEAARGADKRKSGAMRSRAGEPVPEIRTAKTPSGANPDGAITVAGRKLLAGNAPGWGFYHGSIPGALRGFGASHTPQNKTPSVAVKPRTGPLAGQ